MADQDDDPILKALPPASDYITYLTILEYQLTSARLPSLEKVLQDDSLAENIGWDLLHLLLPLLPESQECLNLVAKKGNPREVVIRITESLSKLNKDDHAEEETLGTSSIADDDHPVSKITETLPDLTTNEPESETVDEPGAASAQEHLVVKNDPLDDHEIETSKSLQIPQFKALLSMLTIVHPRISTKYPSRFLATSLPAVLSTYRRMIATDTTEALVKFIGAASGRQRPVLPSRDSASEVPSTKLEPPLPDPEATKEGQVPSQDEETLVLRLLQAALLESLEDYVLQVGDSDHVGMGWEERIREKLDPSKLIPGRQTTTTRFSMEDELQARDSTLKLFFVCSCRPHTSFY